MTSPYQRSRLLLISALVLLCSTFPIGVVGLNQDGILLLAFKYSVQNDPLGALRSWNYDDANPCSWNGVACTAVPDANGGGSPPTDVSRVISLVLPNAQLLGSVAPDLGLIEHLRHLDLSGNFLNGTLPSALFNATELRVLSLANNEISGELPELVGNLVNLQKLNLADNALIGRIPVSLSLLPNLTAVSLSNNYIFGSVPPGFAPAESIDLSSNLVNGSLPPDGLGGAALTYLNLSYNRLTGEIPSRFASLLPANATVDLSYNNLTGPVPNATALVAQKPRAFAGNADLCGKPLRNLCSVPSMLSDPPLNGTVSPGTSPPAFAAIPKPVGGYAAAAAAGGSGKQRQEEVQGEGGGGLRPVTIAGIVVGDLAGVGLLFVLFLYIYHAKKKKKFQQQQQQLQGLKPSRIDNGAHKQQWSSSSPATEPKGVTALSLCIGKKGSASKNEDTSETTGSDSDQDEGTKKDSNTAADHEKKGGLLVMVDGETELELETLLKASAYILGATGSSIVYKAVLADGTAFAVRRIGEDGSAEKLRDFDAQVKSIAKLRHPNLVSIRGYYWGADEKLLIYDYVSNGSLANISYKKLGSSPYHLPWETRLRIAKGVARGLAYLHDKKSVHGNLKPSNILLGHDMDPRIGDFGMDRLASGGDSSSRPGNSFRHFGSKRSSLSQSSLQEPSPTAASPCGGSSSTPYHAPECLRNLKPSAKWDVYSFGVVLLELMTGRVFSEAEVGEVGAVVMAAEERGRVVRMADVTMRGELEGKEEAVVSCIRLGFSCAAAAPQRRPSMKDALQVLEKIPSSSSSTASSSLP